MIKYRRDDLLVILIEECSEVIKEATKILRGDNSAERRRQFNEEVGDVEILIEILTQRDELDRIAINHMKAKKRAERG